VLTSSRGFDIHYTVAGGGPPLVLVPGTFGSAQDWLKFGYTPALERHWRVIAIDPLGHGLSERPHWPDDYDAASVTADLVAVLDAESVERATVWGYSRGGWLACNLAARHPDRVDRLVVGGYAMHAHTDEVKRLRSVIEALRSRDWPAVFTTFGVNDPKLQRTWEENDHLAVAAAIEGSLAPTRFIDHDAIRCPCAYYVGSQDWIGDQVRADVEELDATVDVIAGYTHVDLFYFAATTAMALVRARIPYT
jgi:pimeloyl-ACP methyl ester carboxylesterase